MQTPINRFKLSSEGKKIFDMVDYYANQIIIIKSKAKRIPVTSRQYALLLEGTPELYHKYDGIPYGEFFIVRI